MIDLGAVYQATVTITDANGTLVNPATAVLTITLPDDSTATPAVALPPLQTGLLIGNYATTQPGLHKAVWTTTLPDTRVVDYFSVRDYVSVVSMAEAMDHLNITRTPADGGAELRRFMQAATELIEAKVGICVPRAFTDLITEGGYALVLPHRPVLSVTSITSQVPGGMSWSAGQFIVGGETGVITPQWGNWPFFNWPPFLVAYTCGRAVIPERFEHAAKEQLRHLWETQRGSQPPSLLSGEQEFTATTGWSFSVPRRVLELLEQDMVPSS